MENRYLYRFIVKLRSNGKYAFSLEDIRSNFNKTDETIKKGLLRLKEQNEIAVIRKGFYVIITPEYRDKGMIPPSLFISELMKYLEKDYYTGLLNAAAFHGAAHQQPQTFSVITVKPSLRNIARRDLKINFYVKKNWSANDIIKRKTDAGFINVSSPELTALDLVYYYEQVGGFNKLTTVLEELTESMKPKKLAESAERFPGTAPVQRLGFLLEEILGKKDLCFYLKRYLKTKNHYPVLLDPQKENNDKISGNEWKIIMNTKIEIDL